MNIIKKILIKKKLKRHNNKYDNVELISLKSTIISSELASNVLIADYSSVHSSKIGKYSTVGRYSKVVHSIIGAYCAISWDCTINAIKHPIDNLTISAFPYVPYLGNFVSKRNQNYQNVIIGNDVWIGANSVIMPGITISDGAVIGAGSVVTKNVPPYAIVGGVPAKIIKYRFDEVVINRLLTIKWWEFNEKIIKNNIELFQKKLDNETLDLIEQLKK